MDAAIWMETFALGAVAGLRLLKSISVLKALSKEQFNSFRCGRRVNEYSMLQVLKDKNSVDREGANHGEKAFKKFRENH